MYVSHIVSIKDAVYHSFKVSKYYPEGNKLALKLKDLVVGSGDKKTAKSIAMHSYKKKLANQRNCWHYSHNNLNPVLLLA